VQINSLHVVVLVRQVRFGMSSMVTMMLFLLLLKGVHVAQYHLLNLLSLNSLHILTVTLELSLALISIFLPSGKAITRLILSFLYLLKMY
jgi:hypothetical protein